MSVYAAWKATERKIARRLGGRRVGHQSGPVDVDAGWLQVQVKHRKRLPLWLTEALNKVRAATNDQQLGIVVLHEHGKRDDLIVLSLADWQQWFGA